LVLFLELESANSTLASIAASQEQAFSPVGTPGYCSEVTSPHNLNTSYPSDNACAHCSPATPIPHADHFSNPSTPTQLSSPNSHQTFHSTPHGPGHVCLHTNTPSVSQAHPAVSSLIPNCSPLVKADLHPGSPRMSQKIGPQVKKNIFQQPAVSQWSQQVPNPASHSAVHSTPIVADLGLEHPETTGYLNLLNEAIDQYNNGQLLQTGVNDLFTSIGTCSTIDNTIDCISLPKQEPVTMVSRKHGQGQGKKGKKKKATKKGQCRFHLHFNSVYFDCEQ